MISPLRAHRSPSEAGQAAVETALTLPLTLFIVLGTVQLFAMQQGRLMAQYAVSRSARAGSISSGDCLRMTHSALAALLPAIHTLTKDRPAAMGAAFGARRSNHFAPPLDEGRDENIVWVLRDGPTGIPADIEETFDLPYPDGPLLILEARLVFWYPLRIPFANWVIARLALAQYGLQAYRAADPLVPTHRADWKATDVLDSAIGAELRRRTLSGHYAFPLQVRAATRMMTPPRRSSFTPLDCDPDDPRYQGP